MSNTIGYSIGSCSTGESFDFSQSPYNDLTGSSLSSVVSVCRKEYIPPSEEISLSYSSSGAVPSLIGFSEFTDPSSPPKKYLRNDIDIYVKYFVMVYPSCDCSSSIEQTFYYVIGSATYDPVSGTQTAVPAFGSTQKNIGSCTHGEPQPLGMSYMVADADPNIFSVAKTQTTYIGTPHSECYRYVIQNNVVAIDNSRANNTLSIEDTESNAIARAAWTTGSDSVAQRTVRTTGFSFTYIKVTPTAVCTGLDVGYSYQINYTIKTKNLSTNASSYVLGIQTFTSTAETQNVVLPELDPASGFSCEITTYSITKL